MNVLAVIPARGGSKGIPRKNVRLINGKPLISYAIKNAKTCNLITDIVVTTDDDEIIGLSKFYEVDFINRAQNLSGDNITLDPVVHDAVDKMEQRKKIKYDVVITLQATSPLLKADTLSKAIESFIHSGKDTIISAINNPHLSWSKSIEGYSPNYEERLNRQLLPPNYTETGAFFITKREYIFQNSRMGKEISIFEISEEESVDIDTTSDWVVSESILKRKKIVFRVDGHKEIGMGHIYHSLTLAYNLTGHDIIFITNEEYSEGLNKIKESHLPYLTIRNNEELFNFLDDWKPNIFINDCLDTSIEYIKKIKTYVNKVITIEDLGPGAETADAVINALYNNENKSDKIYTGEKYICLRDEFIINAPKEFSKQVNNILVIFGGTDPSNLTKKIYEMAININRVYPKVIFNFITGSGYNCEQNSIIDRADKNIYIHRDVKRVSDYMRSADLAFTSQGRTVFELAALGIPSIVLAQNEREQLHTFAQMHNGFLNLGLGNNVSIATIETTFKWLIETEQIRNEMRELMLKHDLKKGINRVIDIILEED